MGIGKRALRLSSFLVLFVSMSVGCVAPGPYYWGQYEGKLYSAYKNPETVGAFNEHLLYIIETAPEKGKRIPPGICAEYGYALFLSDQMALAVQFFEREAQEWPEAAPLMARLIESVEAKVEAEVDAEVDAEEGAASDSSRGSTDAGDDGDKTADAVSGRTEQTE